MHSKACVCLGLALLMLATQASAVQLWCTGGQVKVELLKASAKYTDLLNLYDKNHTEIQAFGNNSDSNTGKVVKLNCAFKSELRFGIRVMDNSNVFFMGDADQNFDYMEHAKLLKEDAKGFTLGFEDLKKTDIEPTEILNTLKQAGGSVMSKDYNDYVIRVSGFVSKTFPVDTFKPVISVVGVRDGGQMVVKTQGNSAIVTFIASATDNVDGTVPVTCDPPSGSRFAMGKTQVTCMAIDSSYNRDVFQFKVRVKKQDRRRLMFV